MRRTLGVLFVFFSIFGFNEALSAQSTGSGGQQANGFQLRQNYPNPFNPETTIPFVLSEDLFVEGRSVVVSMEIFDLLTRPVAQPVALNHPAGPDAKMLNLEFTAPGEHRAFWDGKAENGREVPSGMYFLRLTVNGRSQTIRMFVRK